MFLILYHKTIFPTKIKLPVYYKCNNRVASEDFETLKYKNEETLFVMNNKQFVFLFYKSINLDKSVGLPLQDGICSS